MGGRGKDRSPFTPADVTREKPVPHARGGGGGPGEEGKGTGMCDSSALPVDLLCRLRSSTSKMAGQPLRKKSANDLTILDTPCSDRRDGYGTHPYLRLGDWFSWPHLPRTIHPCPPRTLLLERCLGKEPENRGGKTPGKVRRRCYRVHNSGRRLEGQRARADRHRYSQ